MGYPEKDIWEMNLKKLIALWEYHLDYHGMKPKKLTIDDVIPI